ncbi:MAG: DEAD/DEAH box helicase [Armatimonadota bacterium]
MISAEDCLTQFHPLIATWFREHIGTPTDVQTAAWPKIAAGEHVLVTAPTGSGKTLTAFLWALNQFATGAFPTGRCSVLYISPLKALNNDIQRNLLTPLAELRKVFHAAGLEFPHVRVLTRSGDTPAEERRAMLRRPPEILITTPESLNLLLSSKSGPTLFTSLSTVILDEIHAVIDSKRGVYLMTGVERLVRLCGEFQRIALTATVRPLDLVAAFVGGYQRLDGQRYPARQVAQVRSTQRKAYQVQVRFTGREADEVGRLSIWPTVVQECKEIIRQNRSTLLFTNTRRLAESITWMLNADEPEMLAYAHHGSLAREIRSEVEHRLKEGRLRAIVATNSLELGIDIGSLDEVVLIQSPFGIASAIQRIGRAGHRVGEPSKATLFATHAQDLLTSAVLARDVLAGDIEEAKAIRCPLDVLAQLLISMTGVETWDIDELFAEVRRSHAFHPLTREQFDLVLNMLAGRYAETRVRELEARVSIDRIDNTISARGGALQTLYMSGGMIPDRGYYHLRHQESGGLVGELDEEYVWEATVGQVLTFGTQNWRIERITHNDVFAIPIASDGKQAPFWKAEQNDRGFHFSAHIARFLEEANERLDDPAFIEQLQRDHCLEPQAAKELVDYLKGQREFCDSDLPHRHHLLIEHVETGPYGHPGNQIILHTFWGGRVNRPYALALAEAWAERFGEQPEVYTSDNAIYLLLTREISGAELLSLVTDAGFEPLLRKKLESSGFFGARFRECAGRALLITRRRMRERLPLWVSRLRSKRLLESISHYPDFPILLEAWRTCLQDEFDLDHLRDVLAECESGEITWSEVHTAVPSPFARAMAWYQMNQYIYMDDTPTGGARSQLRSDLLREVVFSPDLRPAIAPDVIARYLAKRQRVAENYAPQSARDLLDWVKERLLIPREEWRQLLAAMACDHALSEEALLHETAGKLVELLPDATSPLIAATEQLPRLLTLWQVAPPIRPLSGKLAAAYTTDDSNGESEENITALIGEWLSFYGPVAVAFVSSTLGLTTDQLQPCLDDLLDTQRIIQGRLIVDGSADDLLDSENYEILLRMARASAVPAFTPLPCESLPLFLAQHQGLCAPGEKADDLWERLEQLSGYPARAELWEEAILPARIARYDTAWLDSLLQQGAWHWVGSEKGKIAFSVEDDLALLRDTPAEDDLCNLLPDAHARYPLHAISMHSAQRMEDLVGQLWDGVWRGQVSNDTMSALRKGIAMHFQTPKLPQVNEQQRSARRVPRGGFRQWSAAAPFAGNWYRLPVPPPPDDLLEQEERAKDRVRLLLNRYGILFRELLQWEVPAFQWSGLFRALRLMELSGEIVTGHFFLGIPGLQFISHEAFRVLQRKTPAEAIWWMNACDPASCCGMNLAPLKGRLPKRLPGNYLVFRGQQPVMIIEREGKNLTFHLPPDDPQFGLCLTPLHNLLERRFQPILRLTVEKINDGNPCESPYLDALALHFEVIRDSNRAFLAKRLR